MLSPSLLCRWHTAVDKIKAALPSRVDIKPWRMQIFGQLPYADNYQTFKKKRGSATQPLQRPDKLPALPAGLDVGQVPSVTDLEAAVTTAFSGRQAPEVNLHELQHNGMQWHYVAMASCQTKDNRKPNPNGLQQFGAQVILHLLLTGVES